MRSTLHTDVATRLIGSDRAKTLDKRLATRWDCPVLVEIFPDDGN